MIFLETNEVLKNDDSTSVDKVVRFVSPSWETLHSIGHLCSIGFQLPSFDGIAESHHSEKNLKPEISILSIVKTFIVVHWISWHSSVEISFIGTHVVLELDGVQGSNSG